MSKKNAPATNGNESTNTNRHSTKKAVILAVLKTRSLNRFEAHAFGDFCLHSTIAELRGDGQVFHDEWESVPTKWGREVRVKRYRWIQTAR